MPKFGNDAVQRVDEMVQLGRGGVAEQRVREFLGIAPTGRAVEYTSIELYRLAGGLVSKEWICSDMAILMRQIGS